MLAMRRKKVNENGFQEPKVSVSISRKINVGNYESVDVFMAISGVEAGATEEEIQELLATGDRAFLLLKKNMAGKLKEIRQRVKGEIE